MFGLPVSTIIALIVISALLGGAFLAPNGRAVQVTSDLEGFWSRHYPTVRRELMRRYPKHRWPETPG